MCVFNCQSGILITSRVFWQRISSIILLSCNFPWVSHIIMLPENAPRKIWSPLRLCFHSSIHHNFVQAISQQPHAWIQWNFMGSFTKTMKWAYYQHIVLLWFFTELLPFDLATHHSLCTHNSPRGASINFTDILFL